MFTCITHYITPYRNRSVSSIAMSANIANPHISKRQVPSNLSFYRTQKPFCCFIAVSTGACTSPDRRTAARISFLPSGPLPRPISGGQQFCANTTKRHIGHLAYISMRVFASLGQRIYLRPKGRAFYSCHSCMGTCACLSVCMCTFIVNKSSHNI